MLTALGIIAIILAIYAVTKSVAFEMRKGRTANVDWSTPETIRTVPATRHGHYSAH